MNSASPEGARGIHQSLRAETFVSGILTRRLRNSRAEATILLWGARMAGLGEAPESRMPKTLLIAVVEDDWLFRDSMKSYEVAGLHRREVSRQPPISSHPLVSRNGLPDRRRPYACHDRIELYRHLIDAGYAIPTILVTAYPNDADRLRALKDGVLCYLRKPVDEEHLIRCLRTLSVYGAPDEDP